MREGYVYVQTQAVIITNCTVLVHTSYYTLRITSQTFHAMHVDNVM